MASAAVFAAASQPSTSSDGSASAMPRACISASAASNGCPCSSAVRMKLDVLLMTPRKPLIVDRRHRLAHQVEDRHAVHHRALEEERALGALAPRAQLVIGKGRRSFVGGDDVRAGRRARRGRAIAGSPRSMSSIVVSTTTEPALARGRAARSRRARRARSGASSSASVRRVRRRRRRRRRSDGAGRAGGRRCRRSAVEAVLARQHVRRSRAAPTKRRATLPKPIRTRSSVVERTFRRRCQRSRDRRRRPQSQRDVASSSCSRSSPSRR